MSQAKEKGRNMVVTINARLDEIANFRKDRLEQMARLKANRETILNQIEVCDREIRAANEREHELRSILALTDSEQPKTLPHKEDEAAPAAEAAPNPVETADVKE